MGKRNYVEEILSVRLRNELNPRWGGALIHLQSLERVAQSCFATLRPLALVKGTVAHARRSVPCMRAFRIFAHIGKNAMYARHANRAPCRSTVYAVRGLPQTLSMTF
jgi:hypothetical protein